MEIIAYVAPSVVVGIEQQIEQAREYGVKDKHIRVDRPKKKGGEVPRGERDFVFKDLLRSAADNIDGKPDTLFVASLDVLGDSREEVWALIKTVQGLGIPLVSVADGLEGDLAGTEYAVRLVRALERSERQIRRRKTAAVKKPRKARAGARPAGRPAALTQEDVALVVRLRDEERKTWPEIELALKAHGCRAGQSTIRSYYTAAVTER